MPVDPPSQLDLPLAPDPLATRWDVIVVGAGPAGSMAALRRAGLGHEIEAHGHRLVRVSIFSPSRIEVEIDGEFLTLERSLLDALVAQRLAPKYLGYRIAERWLSRAWVTDLVAWRAGSSRHLREGLSGVLSERVDPRTVFSVRGLLRSLVT